MTVENNGEFPVKEKACACGADHDHDHDHDHGSEIVTLTLEDGSELECPIIDIFMIDKQEYIALFHPIEETALLYRFTEFDDGTIEITSIESDEEFELVQEEMRLLMEEE